MADGVADLVPTTWRAITSSAPEDAGLILVRAAGRPGPLCLLDYDAKDVDRPLLVVVAGLDKAFRTTLSPADYRAVSQLGIEYRARNPRSIT